MSDKIGLQLNGYETSRSPLVVSGACPCCVCCTNSRPEYYVMQDGAVWAVSTDGTIGVLTPDSDEFEVKYHAKHYHSWRLSNASAGSLSVPVLPPDVMSVGFNGSVKFPYWKDLIGFQTDVDQCVIFEAHGTLLYEGSYDGRRFPLFYNGHDRSVFTLDQYEYKTAPVRFPVVNETSSDRFGFADKIRWTAEESGTQPMLDRLSSGFAAVAWQTEFEISNQDMARCGYDPDKDYSYYSSSRYYDCEQPKNNDHPSGNVHEESDPPVLPRDLVRKRVCVPDELIVGGSTPSQRLCEMEDVTRYHKCVTEFAPDTPLEHQLQGFDLNVCGNFVRVILRNHGASGNKWYRYVGNAASAADLPKYLPEDFDLLDIFPDGFGEVPQDDWGVPRWWAKYLQTFYVYGSHDTAKYQWMRFDDQRRADIKNVRRLEVADTLADDERIANNENLDADHQIPDYCDIDGQAERVLFRSDGGFSPESSPSSWDPYDPDTYGIRQFDVMSVGGGTNGNKQWYYFDGLDWILGEGSYQELKNYANEDLNIIFYKGQNSLNQCNPDAHIIPANSGRIQCCGDFLLIGLKTDYETRQVFFKEQKMLDFSLNGVPSPEQFGRESFICCSSFFGFSMLELTSRVQAFFYDLTVDGEGQVTRSAKVWSGSFDVTESPDFSGSCDSGCRYYFARQSDKKGLYFYRDAVNKGYEGIEYGTWRFLKALDIKNETNMAPGSGCVSTGNWCDIPCEGAGDVAGVQRYLNGSLYSAHCEPTQPNYTECSTTTEQITCSGPATCSSGSSSSEAEVDSANVELSVTVCDHYYNVGGQQPCNYPQNTFKLLEQTSSVTSTHSMVMDGTTTTGNVAESGSGYTISSGVRITGDLMAFLEYPRNPFNSIRTVTYENGVQETYALEQCESRLMLRRVSDGAILETLEIEASGDASDLPDVPKIHWALTRTSSVGYSTTTCTICKGDVEPAFTLPGRQYTLSGAYGCQSYQRRGTTGHTSDAACAYYESRSESPNGYGGAVACVVSSRTKIYKRLSGKVYILDPYGPSIRTINTGLEGTTCTETEDQCGGGCCDTAAVIGVCLNGISYAAFQIDGEPDRVVLMRGPEYDDVEKTVVCYTKEYHGKVNAPVMDIHGNLAGCEPDALWGCGTYHDGSIGVCTTLCGIMGNPVLCTASVSCANASGHAFYGEGKLVVDVDWKDHIWRYTVGFSGEELELRCCGPYTIIYLNDTGLLHYRSTFIENVSKEWNFSGCCNEAAVLKHDNGTQRVFIDGQEVDTANIFQGDPYHEVSNAEYPLSIKCCEDYYLFYCHEGNDVEFADKYAPYVNTYAVELDPIDSILGDTPTLPDDALEAWKAENLANQMANGYQMILLDGTPCVAVSERMIQVDDDTVRVGPGRWRTVGVARPAVMDGSKEKYPAVEEYEFDDPFAPWWRESDTRAKSTSGVMSLMSTLLGGENGALLPVEESDPIKMLQQEIVSLGHRKELTEGLIRAKTLEADAMSLDPYSVHFVNALLVEIKGLESTSAWITEQIEAKKVQLGLWLSGGYTGGGIPEQPAQQANNIWLFGFRLTKGKNIAAAYHHTKFLYNDSRLTEVKCFCEGVFGVFYFTGAGYYWWDTPLVERSHEHTEKSGVNALGNDTFRIYRSHFDLYMGLPNPLPHKQLEHEHPVSTENMTALGDWLQKYVPYSAYVFNNEQRLSDTLDVEWADYVEPPSNAEHAGVKPPYNEGYVDSKHPYGDFLYFNDRNAPVRYDRALSWEKPFEDGCEHQDFRLESSLDLIRSPFTDGGSRVITGANGVLHVFDDRLGRMDFNAETLERV